MNNLNEKEKAILRKALQVMESKIDYSSAEAVTNPQDAATYTRLIIGSSRIEQFLVIFLNSQNRIICHKILAQGTIDQSAVYPREIIREALMLDATGIVIAHNHPSGTTTASQADRKLTTRISQCCDLFEIRLLDHIIVTNSDSFYSFAQMGEL